MVLSAIWTLAFGAHNPLPEFPDEAILDDSQDDTLAQDRDSNDNEANIARIHERQRAVIEAERDILATTVYLPIPNVRDESAENKTSFILVVTSFTLNNIGCYPFFGFRDRHQVAPPLLYSPPLSDLGRCQTNMTELLTSCARCSHIFSRIHHLGQLFNTSGRCIGHKECSGSGTGCHVV